MSNESSCGRAVLRKVNAPAGMQMLLSPEWDVKPDTNHLWMQRSHGTFCKIKVSECLPSPTLAVEFCPSKFYNSLIWKTSLPLPQTQLCNAAGAECLLLSIRESISALLVLTHEHTVCEVLAVYSWLHMIEMYYGHCVCIHTLKFMHRHILLCIFLQAHLYGLFMYDCMEDILMGPKYTFSQTVLPT